MQVVSKLIYLMKLLKHQLISEHSVQVKKEQANVVNLYILKILFSIELSQDLWHKEETLQISMVLVVNQYMGIASTMKILFKDTQVQEFYQWLIQVQIQMPHNFLFVLINSLILIKNTQFLGKLAKDMKFQEQSKNLEVNQEKLHK